MEAQGLEQTSTSVESAPPAESAAPAASNASTEASSTPPATAGSQAAEHKAAEAQYTPNYKFKVMDKEHEVDEWIRPIIKDKDTEAKIKQMYEKAYGIDEVKKSRDTVREELKAYKAQAEPTVNTVLTASQLYQQGVQAFKDGNHRSAVFKMEEAFKHLGIPDQVLQQYVLRKLELEELPPDQKADYTRQREIERQYALTQQQLQQTQTQYQQMAVQTRQAELNQVMSKPDINQIVKSFDQRNGEGAFYNEVVLRGRMHYEATKQDVSPEQVVQEIINKYGLQASVQSNASPQASATPKGAEQRGLPVIPSVKGGTGSPAGRTFKSTEDVVKYRKEQFGF